MEEYIVLTEYNPDDIEKAINHYAERHFVLKSFNTLYQPDQAENMRILYTAVMVLKP